VIGRGLLYAMAGVVLFVLGLYGLAVHPHLLRKLIAFNIAGSGVFLALVGLPQVSGMPDPVSQALVLTGIVVAVSATAFGLALMRRLHQLTGATRLEDGSPPKP
jgi:multicomponent Na+:H+ antiporter subunit C